LLVRSQPSITKNEIIKSVFFIFKGEVSYKSVIVS
jgi:hypothetical protein